MCNREVVDRGLRFTVSLRTGAVFLSGRESVRVLRGCKMAVFL